MRQDVIIDITTQTIEGENATEVRIVMPIGTNPTLVLRVEGVTSVDPQTVGVLTGTDGDDLLLQMGHSLIEGGDGNDTINLDDEGEFTQVNPGAGEDVVNALVAGTSASINAADDSDADIVNVRSGAFVRADAEDTINLSVTDEGAPPLRITSTGNDVLGPEDMDIPLNITLPDDWSLDRDLTVRSFDQARDGDNAFRLEVFVGEQLVATIREPDYISRGEIDDGLFVPTNIRLI
tara:strand:+ start:164 stop:868 length:705 start_codon:yes stop_codon:yes gene_type:complete